MRNKEITPAVSKQYFSYIIEQNGVTRADIAELIGTSKDNLEKKIWNQRRWSQDEMYAIAQHLKLKVSDIFFSENDIILKEMLNRKESES